MAREDQQASAQTLQVEVALPAQQMQLCIQASAATSVEELRGALVDKLKLRGKWSLVLESEGKTVDLEDGSRIGQVLSRHSGRLTLVQHE